MMYLVRWDNPVAGTVTESWDDMNALLRCDGFQDALDRYHSIPKPLAEKEIHTWSVSRIPLKSFQEEGVYHLIQNWESGSIGALLCDEMGLGKTAQSIVFAHCTIPKRKYRCLSSNCFLNIDL